MKSGAGLHAILTNVGIEHADFLRVFSDDILREQDNLSPVSKSLIIARFFKQMGRADELGSDTKNLYYYTRLYSGLDPQLDEGDTFKVTVPLNETYSADKGDPIKPHDGINEGIKGVVLQAIKNRPEVTAPELAKYTDKSLATIERSLSALTASNKIEHCGSKKTGGYYAR